ncbi:MAG: GNAT family N-acetyltransferase [Peptoniphilaceae bacterium]|nr:GNAT family N-acetyltransferase [Peptoniphilaceae bacterium]MDY3737642.1 GNAT family N-acetyltransferase [Peptoniphilaceae bacterium]
MKIIEYKTFKHDEIKNLYKEVGWISYTDNMCSLEEGYKRSLKILAAFENDELLGIIRAVGDGFTVVFIQDILVFPDKQRQGIGKALLKAMIDLYSNVRQIELTTDITPKTISFYKSVGFKEFSEIGCCGFIRLL